MSKSSGKAKAEHMHGRACIFPSIPLLLRVGGFRRLLQERLKGLGPRVLGPPVGLVPLYIAAPPRHPLTRGPSTPAGSAPAARRRRAAPASPAAVPAARRRRAAPASGPAAIPGRPRGAPGLAFGQQKTIDPHPGPTPEEKNPYESIWFGGSVAQNCIDSYSFWDLAPQTLWIHKVSVLRVWGLIVFCGFETTPALAVALVAAPALAVALAVALVAALVAAPALVATPALLARMLPRLWKQKTKITNTDQGNNNSNQNTTQTYQNS